MLSNDAYLMLTLNLDCWVSTSSLLLFFFLFWVRRLYSCLLETLIFFSFFFSCICCAKNVPRVCVTAKSLTVHVRNQELDEEAILRARCQVYEEHPTYARQQAADDDGGPLQRLRRLNAMSWMSINVHKLFALYWPLGPTVILYIDQVLLICLIIQVPKKVLKTVIHCCWFSR